MKDATVAIEDSRFYKHKGVDFEGVIRAAVKNLQSHNDVQGGSTLTMQLIRNLYTGDRQRTFARKIKEAKLAEDLENLHPGLRGKKWILTKYLNNVPYGTVGGQTAVGVQAAARIFFDKYTHQLTLPEAAMLAGLPQAPTDYNPFLYPKRALSRRNEVLQQDGRPALHHAGAGRRRRSRAARRQADRLLPPTPRGLLLRLRQVGADQDLRRRHRAPGRPAGLHDDQPQVAEARARGDRRPARTSPGDPSAALVSIDPSNGHILAMASSYALRHVEVQPRRAVPPPGGLDVQGDDADGGDPPRRRHQQRRPTSPSR